MVLNMADISSTFHLLISIKGIVSRDVVSTKTIDVEFRPRHCAAYQFYTIKVAHHKYMTVQTGGLSK
jgi:nitrous oxide reductase